MNSETPRNDQKTAEMADDQEIIDDQADITVEAAEVESDGGLTVQQLGKALHASEDRYLRLAAEYDNYRRRTLKEKTEATDRGIAWLLTRLMDEIDDVDRLGTSDPESTTYEAYRNGFELFQRKLHKELEASGLEWIAPEGDAFDPSIHEAVAVVPPEDPSQDHTVKATFQVGYRYKGMVLRPARVQVYSEQGTA